MQRILRPGLVRDALSGTAIGHPAHPPLAGVPIGCWTAALVADLFGDCKAGRVLTATGVLTAIPAAATGLSDWADTTGAEQRVGVAHMGANLGAIFLNGASWWARARGRNSLGVGLSAAGMVVSTTAAWLGGHLAFGLGVGVDTNAFEGGPTEWTQVDERGDGSATISEGEVAGVGLVLVRSDPEAPGADPATAPVRALANRCSHRGGPLAEGRLIGDCIQCPWHESEFELDSGAVRRGPAVAPQPSYHVRKAGSGLEARRDEPRSLRLNSVRP